jgi:hypothetical protein
VSLPRDGVLLLTLLVTVVCLLLGALSGRARRSAEKAARGLGVSKRLSKAAIREAEVTFAGWLAHAMEYGAAPKRTKYLGSVPTRLHGSREIVDVHVLEYEMADGRYGKGFVHPTTWSFGHALPYDRLTNTQLVVAYGGWLWCLCKKTDNSLETSFAPVTLDALIADLAEDGITGVVVRAQYLSATTEIFEVTAMHRGRVVRAVGFSGCIAVFGEEDPECSLPLIFTFVGRFLRDEV